MARVTVEDCIQVVNNRYELVLLAAQRARDIAAGAQLTLDRDDDKNAVVALREIADQTINLDDLKRHIARGVNRHSDLNIEDDALLALANEAFSMPENAEAMAEISEVGFESDEAPAAEEDEDDVEAIDLDDDAIETEMASLDEMPDLDEVKEELGSMEEEDADTKQLSA